MPVIANVSVHLDAKNAIANAKGLNRALEGVEPAAKKAAVASRGFGAALQSALAPLLAMSTAITVVGKSLNTAFARGAAVQKLKNFTVSAGELNAALAAAANSSQKFGISQTEATTALADTLSRLKGLGFGLKETTQIYDGFNAIALQSGTSAEDAAGAFVQLSQALGSGKLQGDELRSILERMPTLAQRIATSMGKSAGEIRRLGQEGKLTSDIIQKALAEAAEASDNFGNKLTEQQLAQKNLAQVTDRLFNTLGKVFGPAVIKGMETITAIGNELGNWWDYIGSVIFPKVQRAVEPSVRALKAPFSAAHLQPFLVIFQNVLLKAFEAAIQVLARLSTVLGGVIKGFMSLGNNPVFKFIAEQVGRLVNFLGLTNDKVGQFQQEQQKAAQEAAKTVNQYSAMPEKVEDVKQKAKELKEAQQAVTDALKRQTTEIEKQFSVQANNLDLTSSLAAERIKTQKAINNLAQDELKNLIKRAKTDDERIFYAKQLFKLQKQAAKLEFKASKLAIKQALRKVELAYEEVVAKEKAVRTEVALAKANGTLNKQHLKLLQSVKEEVAFGAKRLQVAQSIAREQIIQAKAVRDSRNLAANLAYQQNVVARNTTAAANAAGDYASNMERAASAASKQKTAFEKGTLGATETKTVGTSIPIDEDIRKEVQGRGGFKSVEAMVSALEEAQKQRNTNNLARAARGQAPLGPQRYAQGGYLTKPHIGMVGEAGPEYIIPERKAAAFAMNYLSGARGSNAIPRYAEGGYVGPINIQTGPVMQQGGTNYVTMAQFEDGLRSVVNSVTQNRSYGARRFQGVS